MFCFELKMSFELKIGQGRRDVAKIPQFRKKFRKNCEIRRFKGNW